MWKRNCLLALFLLFFTVVQITVIPFLPGWLRKIDLLLSLTIAFALLTGPVQGACVGFLAGLLRGIAVGPALGIYAVALFIIGYSVGSVSAMVNRDSSLVQIIVGGVATLLHWIVMTLLTGGFYDFWISGWFWAMLPANLTMNCLVVCIVYLWLKRCERTAVRGRG